MGLFFWGGFVQCLLKWAKRGFGLLSTLGKVPRPFPACSYSMHTIESIKRRDRNESIRGQRSLPATPVRDAQCKLAPCGISLLECPRQDMTVIQCQQALFGAHCSSKVVAAMKWPSITGMCQSCLCSWNTALSHKYSSILMLVMTGWCTTAWLISAIENSKLLGNYHDLSSEEYVLHASVA